MNESLGLLEVKGLLGAITMADVMVKASNVHVVNIDRANGFGWFTVKVIGDVGAIQSAIQAGTLTAKEMGCFIGSKVIPRVSQSVVDMFLKEEEVKENVEPNQKNDTIESISVEEENVIAISEVDTVVSTVEDTSEIAPIEAALASTDNVVDEVKGSMTLVEITEDAKEVKRPQKSTKAGKSKKKSTSKK